MKDDKSAGKTTGESFDESDHIESGPSEDAVDAIMEIMSDVGAPVSRDDAVSINQEAIEKFTSPLMIQRAAGATSQVSITMSPAGGVDSARSTKGRNIFLNLREAAFASLNSIPTLMALHEKFAKGGTSWGLTIAAVIALLALLKTLSSALKVSVSKQTAGILYLMWSVKGGDDSVSQAGLLEQVNSRFSEYKWEKVDDDDLISELERLEKIGCIERTSSYSSISVENIRWTLKERVRLAI